MKRMNDIRLLIDEVCAYYGIENSENIIAHWNEPHRYYHTLEHLEDLCTQFITVEDREKRLILICAALFHDIVYVPAANDNEEKSVAVLAQNIGENHPHFTTIRDIILDTKNHAPHSELSEMFCYADMRKVTDSSLTELIEWDKKIFLEFQKFDYSFYRIKRIEFLNEMVEKYPQNAENISKLIEYVKNKTPKIGVYAGSFNPFHNGHLNILNKARKIFDKVIVAQGINPEKHTLESGGIDTVHVLEYLQTEQFTGLLTDYINLKEEYADITLIRGLRNGNDLAYEANQLRFMENLKPNLKIIFLLCDMEFEHISSSALRNLEKIRMGLSEPYIP